MSSAHHSPQAWKSIHCASLYFLSLCLSLGYGPPSPSPSLSLPCLWLPFLSTVSSTHKAPMAASRVGRSGELLMKSGSSCQGLGSTLCQPFSSPDFISELSCLTTDFSSLSPSHHLSTGDGRRALSFFHQKGLQDFDTLLLSGDGDTLYVGAREAILALNIQDPGVPRLKNMVRGQGKGVGWE